MPSPEDFPPWVNFLMNVLCAVACVVFLFTFGFLRRKPRTKFPVRWKATLGIYQSPVEYELALESQDVRVDHRAHHLLMQIVCSKERVEICLTSATREELGLTVFSSIEEFRAAILSRGGKFCPAEVGPALRLVYKNQPVERLCLAMEAVSDSIGGLSVFRVVRDGDVLELKGYDGGYDGHLLSFCGPHDEIVFAI